MMEEAAAKFKPLLTCVLFCAFVATFGYPAYRHFAKRNVHFVETKQSSQPLQSPAVTVCVDNVSHVLKLYNWSSSNLSRELL